MIHIHFHGNGGANNNFQDAINIVAEGDTIIIAPGNYNSSFILDKYLIIAGSIAGGNNVTNIYPLGGNPVIKLNASGLSNFSPLTIRNLNIFPNFDPGKGKDGIFIGDGKNLTYISIESVNFLGTNRAYPGLESGIYVDMDASISNIEISDCSFSDLAYGIIVNKSSTSYSNFSGVSITNCYFDNNISKGMYFEKLSNATINSCIFNNNGNIGKAASWAKDFTAGLDINLKYGSYSNISISNCNFSNNGIGSLYGGALLIKARGTGNDPSYSSVVATLNGVTINNCSLNNNSADIRIGENGKSNTSPNDLNINGNVFLSTNKIIDARALPADRVNAKGNWWGTVDQGIITASVNGLIDYSPWWGANYVNDSHGTGWNWISNANLQSTINHQSILSGDTVFLTPGEYTESFTINKAITFSSLDTSNKAVIKGTGTRTYIASSGVILKDIIYNLTGDTSTDGIIVIDRGGGWPNYTIQYSNITMSGLEVLGGRRALYATVGNALIENSRFESQFRDALFFNAVSGNTIIRNNYFSGADAGKAVLFENFSSGDPAVSGSILIEDNTIEGKRNFLVYNQWQNPSVTVSIIIKKNYIAPYGTAISVYDPREFIASFDPLNFSKVNSFEVRLNRFVLNSGQKGVEGPIEIKNKIDVRRNWWGKTGGPENDALSSGINPIPWCFDEDCTKFSPINVAPGDSIKSAIDKAEDGDTIVVDMPEITEVFTIDRNVTLKFSEPPVIDSFKVYNANLTVATDITIKSGINLSNGNIITTENAKIIFDSTAVPPVETETAKIIGIVEITPREVGSGAVQLLGLEIEPGEDNLGKVSLIRKSGNEGIVTVSGNSGISMTWDISVDNQPENGRVVKFTWLPHFDNGINPSSVIVYRNTGSGWEYYAGPFNADGNPREVIINATGFSSWTIGGSDAPLPVELIYFGANVVNNNINLIWHTATETSNYGFEIERFVKLIDDDWQKIGFVQGNGNSYSPKEYLFIDENPPAGVINYRLKQIDFDGSFEYYQYIAEVNFSLTRIEENEVLDEYKLYQNYPNPFNPLTTIKYVVPATGRGDIASQNILLIVYDLLGREIAVLVNEPKKPGIYIVEFNGSNLSSGIYLYTLQSGNYRAVRKLLLMK